MQALIDTRLKEYISAGKITYDGDLSSYMQPASMDVPVGNTAYLVKQKFLPLDGPVMQYVNELKLEEIDLTKGALLLKGHTYLIPSIVLDVAEDIVFSPKSSMGRIDVMVRAVIDNNGFYDSVTGGATGMVWLEVTPISFNVRMYAGLPVTQVRLFTSGKNELDISDLDLVIDDVGKSVKKELFYGNLVLHVGLPAKGLVAYKAKETNAVIDLKHIGGHDANEFFEPVYADSQGRLILEKEAFYIVGTKYKLTIPGKYCAEMKPFSHLLGELRVHYAGFFDPNFGHPKGSTGVLEIRSHEPITITDGQAICFMEFFENTGTPEVLYGDAGNNYQFQSGPRLGKYFKMD